MSEMKVKVAKAALQYIEDNSVLGVGSGSTVHCFIKELASIKHRIDACVASSEQTAQLLRAEGIPVIDLNVTATLPLYIDGADEVDAKGQMIKGGGGALTREKIVASVAEQFICIVAEQKLVSQLGAYPVAVEVIPMARSFVARRLVTLGGDPEYREGFVTDNGNIILDVYNLPLEAIVDMENAINLIPGVVENGLFAARRANKVLVSSEFDVRCLTL